MIRNWVAYQKFYFFLATGRKRQIFHIRFSMAFVVCEVFCFCAFWRLGKPDRGITIFPFFFVPAAYTAQIRIISFLISNQGFSASELYLSGTEFRTNYFQNAKNMTIRDFGNVEKNFFSISNHSRFSWNTYLKIIFKNNQFKVFFFLFHLDVTAVCF